MKKIITLLLVVFMTFGLAACGESNVATVEEKGLRVGFGRADVTPSYSVPLAGYGNSSMRMSQGFLDYLYVTCIAITDETDRTVLLLTAAVSSSVFSAISRGISAQFSPFERTYVMFALGSVVFTGIAIAENWSDPAALLIPLSVPRFWVAVAYLAIVSSVGAFLLLNFAMNHISVAKASIFSNFTTVISVLAGIFIMHDSFTPVQLLGIVIITLSVCGVSYRKEPAATPNVS